MKRKTYWQQTIDSNQFDSIWIPILYMCCVNPISLVSSYKQQIFGTSRKWLTLSFLFTGYYSEDNWFAVVIFLPSGMSPQIQKFYYAGFACHFLQKQQFYFLIFACNIILCTKFNKYISQPLTIDKMTIQLHHWLYLR